MARNTKDLGGSEQPRPLIFGRPSTESILDALACNGISHIREIARLTSAPVSTISDAAHRLTAARLVRTGRSNHGFAGYTLNSRLTVYPELLALLLALHERWPLATMNVRRNSPAWGRSTTLERPLIEKIDGWSIRLRLLLTVQRAGQINMSELAESLETSYPSAWRVVRILAHESVLRAYRSRKNRVVTLEERFPAATELHHFLGALNNVS